MEVVLFEPEIPPNTGNIARLCAVTGTRLHLIEPLGFRLEDRYLKRAGLDYWPHVQLSVWPDMEAFCRDWHATRPNARLVITSSKKGGSPAHRFAYRKDDILLFGKETAGLPEEVKANEMQVAIEKTKVEQVQKAVEAALKKAGFNLYIAENEEHLNEGVMKGNITEAQAQEIRELKEKVAAEKAANLPAQMVENIAKGRMAKFYKENCLLNQEYIQDAKMTVADYLKSVDKDLTVLDFKRFTLRAE